MNDKKMNEYKQIIIDLEAVEKEYGIETKRAVIRVIEDLFKQAEEVKREYFKSLSDFRF
jgi:CRISPR/Cas system CSM-associated protein Csm2 small subunit